MQVTPAIPIIYTDDRSELIPDENNFLNMFISQFIVKAQNWEYEKEYRLFLSKGTNQIFIFPDEIVDSIILGMRIRDDDIKQILDSLKRREHKIPVYHSIEMEDRFGLEFNKIDY